MATEEVQLDVRNFFMEKLGVRPWRSRLSGSVQGTAGIVTQRSDKVGKGQRLDLTISKVFFSSNIPIIP